MSIKLIKIYHDNINLWNKFITNRNDSTFVDTIQWRNVLEKNYNFKNYWYLVKNNDEVEGAMALTLSAHPIFGRYLATAPFGNQGGFYADTDEAARLLLETASELTAKLKTKYTVIRHNNINLTCPYGWIWDKKYASFILPLTNNPKEFMKSYLRAKDRNQIKKTLTRGFSALFGTVDLLDEFWFVITRAMRELGSPYHSKYYLEVLLQEFNSNAELVIINNNTHQPSGAALLIYHKNTAILLHANVLNEYRASGCGDFLYWSIIEHCCLRGFKSLDMGRSLVNSGNEKYKMKFRPQRVLLSYWYDLSPGTDMPDLNQENPKYNLAIKTWKYMPLWITKRIGPTLISGIL